MNKIIYPNKDEMNKQIEEIIDKSEIFSAIPKDEGVLKYTEFTPINKHKNIRKNVYTVAAAAAILLISVGAVNKIGSSITGNNNRNDLEPLNSISGEETTRTDDDSSNVTGQDADDIESKANKETSPDSTEDNSLNNNHSINGSDMEKFKTYSINNNISAMKIIVGDGYRQYTADEETGMPYSKLCDYVMFSYKNIIVTRVTDYYLNIVDSSFSDIMNKWNMNYEGETLKTLDYSCTPDLVNCYSGNEDVVSVLTKYTAEYKQESQNKAFQCVISNNFNGLTGNQISLDDLFVDSQKGKEEMFTWIKNAIQEDFSDDKLSEQYKKSNFDIETGNGIVVTGLNDNQCNWYFGEDGISVICNNIIGDEINEYEGDIDNYKASIVTYTVPYSELSQLQDKYKINK